jgi:hypothetical protein
MDRIVYRFCGKMQVRGDYLVVLVILKIVFRQLTIIENIERIENIANTVIFQCLLFCPELSIHSYSFLPLREKKPPLFFIKNGYY